MLSALVVQESFLMTCTQARQCSSVFNFLLTDTEKRMVFRKENFIIDEGVFKRNTGTEVIGGWRHICGEDSYK